MNIYTNYRENHRSGPRLEIYIPQEIETNYPVEDGTVVCDDSDVAERLQAEGWSVELRAE